MFNSFVHCLTFKGTNACHYEAVMHTLSSYHLMGSSSLPTLLSAMANIIFLPFFQIAFKSPNGTCFRYFLNSIISYSILPLRTVSWVVFSLFNIRQLKYCFLEGLQGFHISLSLHISYKIYLLCFWQMNALRSFSN